MVMQHQRNWVLCSYSFARPRWSSLLRLRYCNGGRVRFWDRLFSPTLPLSLPLRCRAAPIYFIRILLACALAWALSCSFSNYCWRSLLFSLASSSRSPPRVIFKDFLVFICFCESIFVLMRTTMTRTYRTETRMSGAWLEYSRMTPDVREALLMI